MAADLPTVATAAGPDVDDEHVLFRLADPDGRFTSVRLVQDVRVPGDLLTFARSGDGWSLELPRPDVWRMEYLFTVESRDGTTEWLPDPANPRRVGGAFGDKSVLEFPDYRAPAWLSGASDRGRHQPLEIPARSVADSITGSLWSPHGAQTDEPLPLLVVHDGPEYDALAQLTTYLAAMAASGHLPRVRAALLSPGPRDDWYSGNSAYTRALCLAVVPRLRETHATTAVVGVGASLGALALLHAQRRHAETFDALFLQSGSFFHPRFDAHERRFDHYDRIVRSVDGVLRAGGHRSPVPVVMTCGRIEENLENNRTIARALGAQGYDVALHELPDVHNYTAWRDAFDPYLTRLLRMVSP